MAQFVIYRYLSCQSERCEFFIVFSRLKHFFLLHHSTFVCHNQCLAFVSMMAMSLSIDKTLFLFLLLDVFLDVFG